jgi:hypothetical protein
MSLHIDDEIYELEQRLARRRHSIEYLAGAAKNRAMKGLLSPVTLISAAGLGFIATLGLARRRKVQYVPAHAVGKAGRFAGIAGVLASVAFSVLRAQFGSPTQIAQMLLAKFQKPSRPPAYSARQPAHGRP